MGFDEHCVWPGFEAEDKRLHEDSKYWAPVLQTNGERREYGKEAFGPDLVANFVVDWIARQAKAARPWLLFWPMLLCHKPFTRTPAASGKGKSPAEMRHMAEYMDKLVGRALAAVDDAGARERTVVIFTDDQGWADIGTQGAVGFETPHLDRLAAEGTRFTDFYAAQPVCSASRTALLTGCYPNRLGIHGAIGPRNTHGINDEETTLAEVCKSRGYATAMFGKWHLGMALRKCA